MDVKQGPSLLYIPKSIQRVTDGTRRPDGTPFRRPPKSLKDVF